MCVEQKRSVSPSQGMSHYGSHPSDLQLLGFNEQPQIIDLMELRFLPEAAEKETERHIMQHQSKTLFSSSLCSH